MVVTVVFRTISIYVITSTFFNVFTFNWKSKKSLTFYIFCRVSYVFSNYGVAKEHLRNKCIIAGERHLIDRCSLYWLKPASIWLIKRQSQLLLPEGRRKIWWIIPTISDRYISAASHKDKYNHANMIQNNVEITSNWILWVSFLLHQLSNSKYSTDKLQLIRDPAKNY